MKIFLKLLGLMGILIVAGLGYGAYSLGIIGTPKPKDLNVTYSVADLTRADSKSGVESSISGGATMIKYEGSHAVSQSFTAQELTAVANERAWSSLPFSNVQIRINPDNSVEFSGNLDTVKLSDYLVAAGGLSSADATKVKSYSQVQGNPSFYLNTTGVMENNKISLSINSVQVGPITVPTGYISQYQPMVVKFINSRLAAWEGMKVNSLTFKDSLLVFDGQLPDREIISQ